MQMSTEVLTKVQYCHSHKSINIQYNDLNTIPYKILTVAEGLQQDFVGSSHNPRIRLV